MRTHNTSKCRSHTNASSTVHWTALVCSTPHYTRLQALAHCPRPCIGVCTMYAFQLQNVRLFVWIACCLAAAAPAAKQFMLFIQYKHATTRRIPFSGNEQTDDGSDVVVPCTCIIVFTILVVAVTVMIVIGNYSTASHPIHTRIVYRWKWNFRICCAKQKSNFKFGTENQLKIFDWRMIEIEFSQNAHVICVWSLCISSPVALTNWKNKSRRENKIHKTENVTIFEPFIHPHHPWHYNEFIHFLHCWRSGVDSECAMSNDSCHAVNSDLIVWFT